MKKLNLFIIVLIIALSAGISLSMTACTSEEDTADDDDDDDNDDNDDNDDDTSSTDDDDDTSDDDDDTSDDDDDTSDDDDDTSDDDDDTSDDDDDTSDDDDDTTDPCGGCPEHSHCVGTSCQCDENYHQEGTQCVPDTGDQGMCVGFSDGQGGTTLECRAMCTPAAFDCGGTDFICLPYAVQTGDTTLELGGGYCMHTTDANWINTIPSCDPQATTPCTSLNDAQGVCLSDAQNNTYCLPMCNLVTDTCPAGPYPNATGFGDVAFACVGYPDGQGGSVGLCEPWGDAPTCATQNEECSL